jgi:two-component system, cell cycle response regulator
MSQGSNQTTHVLLLAGTAEARERFGALFNISGLHTAVTGSVEELKRHLDAAHVDVVLIALDEPQSPLLEALVHMRGGDSPYRDTPVVVTLPEGSPLEAALDCMHAGAYDYLIEPFNEIELLTKLTVLARIKYAEDEFRELAVKDRITGTYDRRYLMDRIAEESSRAKRYNVPLAAVVVDLEGTALINEQYGTDAGDALLRLVAGELAQIKRKSDVLARLEGDEFAMVFYNCTPDGALILADRIRRGVSIIIPPFESTYRPSASIGIALWNPADGADPALIVDLAEQACHTASLQGRGAMVVA